MILKDIVDRNISLVRVLVMKLQLDTTNKTIKIEENVQFSKLMSVVKRLLPHGEWQDFTLLTNTTIEHWSTPIIYREYYPNPTTPWWQSPWISNPTFMATNGNQSSLSSVISTNNEFKEVKTDQVLYSLKGGTYNIEI